MQNLHFHAIYTDLSTKHARERDIPQEMHGTVQFCVKVEECERLWFFYDRELAAELFDLVYQNRVGSVFGDEFDVPTIDQFWSLRDFGIHRGFALILRTYTGGHLTPQSVVKKEQQKAEW